jgi:hypothetical protein
VKLVGKCCARRADGSVAGTGLFADGDGLYVSALVTKTMLIAFREAKYYSLYML